MSGSPSIDGRDHDINGTLLPSPPDTNYKPGVGVLTKADSTTVSAYDSKINGSQDVKVDTTIPDPSSYVSTYINAASYTYGSGVYNSNMSWGTATNPTIVYCNGTVKFNGNAQGYGMLVVNGSLTLAGTFQWHGIVICYQSTTIDVQFASGTPNVYGAVLAAGATGSDFIMKGNSNVSYSAAAVNEAEYEINRLQVYRVIYWYE